MPNTRNAKPTAEAEPSGGVEAVNRALQIVRCFRDGDDALSLAELAARTGLYKSTILRLAVSLEKAGFLVRYENKSFALGHELMRLGGLYQRSFRLEHYVRPVLRHLLDVTGESASFFRREGDRRICLFREDSTHSVRDHIRVGDALSVTTGAAGHVLTRFDPAAAPPSSRGPLFEELTLLSFGERDPEIAAAAVPVFSGHGGLVGALTISGPLTRFTPEKIAEVRGPLLKAGRDLSAALGGYYP